MSAPSVKPRRRPWDDDPEDDDAEAAVTRRRKPRLILGPVVEAVVTKVFVKQGTRFSGSLFLNNGRYRK